MTKPRVTQGLIIELMNKGLSPAQAATALGVSKQLVNYHLHQTPSGHDVKVPAQVAKEAMPWASLPREHMAGPHERLTLHSRFMVSGSTGMSERSKKILTGWWRRLIDRNEILEYVPNAPAEYGASAGWRYRDRKPEEGRQILRENEHTRLTDNGRIVWRIPPEDTWP